MKNSKQILLAFLIPFSLAIVLTGAGLFIYPRLIYYYTGIEDPSRYGKVLCCSGDGYSPTLNESIYGFIIVGLILLAELLPFIIYLRSRQSSSGKLKLINN